MRRHQEIVDPEDVVPQPVAHGPEESGGDLGVGQSAVVVVPGEAEVGAAVDQSGPALQPQVDLGHRQGVDRGHPAGGQRRSAVAPAFGPQEGEVKAVDIVPDDHPARQLLGQVGMDHLEGRRAFEHGDRNTMHLGGPRIAVRIDQSGEAPHLLALGIEDHHPHLDDALVLGREPGRLHVDHGESRPVVRRLHANHRRGSV